MREKVTAVGDPTQCCDLPSTKRLVTHLSLIICVLLLAAAAPLPTTAAVAAAKTALARYRATDHKAQDEILKLTSPSHLGAPLNFHGEYLDSKRFEESLSESQPNVYRGKKIDLVIAVFHPALRFGMNYHDQMFPDVPSISRGTPASILATPGLEPRPHADWARSRRRNIPKSSLPGASIWYRLPIAGPLELKYVVFGLVLIFVQALLIIGLLSQRSRNRKADLRLRESEERFRQMVDTTPALIWMCDKNGNVTYLNDRRIDFTGQDPAAGLGDAWSAFIHSDDLQSVLTAKALSLDQQKGFSNEYRLRRRDGVYRWMLDVAAPRINKDLAFAGFIGSAVDITDQKLAREALEKIGGKLIEAQEEERTRIARELHDDICQRLALLSMELEQANRGTNGSSGLPNPKIEEVRRHCADIAHDVQALSHKLHSSKLEYLGMVAAIRSFCHEFCQQYEVSIQFSEEDVPGFLPRDISLSLFRITQEALQNALKHSGVSKFSVSLRGTADEILLEVSDQGAGFDVEKAKREKGLGFVSMQERVHLIHGIFTIESTVNCGTTILVRVPLVAETKALASAADSA